MQAIVPTMRVATIASIPTQYLHDSCRGVGGIAGKSDVEFPGFVTHDNRLSPRVLCSEAGGNGFGASWPDGKPAPLPSRNIEALQCMLNALAVFLRARSR